MSARILVVDDDADMRDLLAQDLRRRGLVPRCVASGAAALQELEQGSWDVLLTDLRMPGIDGLELSRQAATRQPDVPVVVLTAFGSMEAAVSALRAGVYDFVTKPVDLDLLALSLERAVRHRRLQEQVQVLQSEVDSSRGFDEMAGESPPMRELYDQIARLAPTDATVLVTGESGTGKELVARVMHRQSARRKARFVAIDCAALPEQLVESELFGHCRGAFTDARSARKGLFVEADGGTVFLDEVGDLPAAVQPKLLRALEERQVRPVGGNEEVPFDVRLVAATNRDLEGAVASGTFREDLLYRIDVVRLHLPPLRARGMDVLLLAQRFVEHFAARHGKQVHGITESACARLLDYDWPGNVRELRNAIERGVALARHDRLVTEDLPAKLSGQRAGTPVPAGPGLDDLLPLEAVERRYVLHVLKATGDNRSMAARILGLDRKTLYRKLQQYGGEAASAD